MQCAQLLQLVAQLAQIARELLDVGLERVSVVTPDGHEKITVSVSTWQTSDCWTLAKLSTRL